MKSLKTEKCHVPKATTAETHSYIRPYWDVLQKLSKSNALSKCKVAGKKLYTQTI